MDWERFAVIDVETTGLVPQRDRVVEIACVLVDAGRIGDRWSTLVNPGIPIPQRATQIHGIDDDAVAHAPSLANTLDTLMRRTDGRIVAAHNAGFDLSFLPELAPPRAICTMRLARIVAPDAPNHKNQTLRAYFNIDRYLDADAVAHRALGDALVTAHVLLACRRSCTPATWMKALQASALSVF